VERFLNRLREAGKPEKVQSYSTTIKNALEVWGVPVPDMRAVAKDLTREPDSLEICRQLWEVKVREPRLLAALVLQSLAKKTPDQACSLCVQMSNDLCHWEETDQLSVALWEACKRTRQVEAVGRLLATADNPWQKRLAIVFLIRGLRKGEVDMAYLEELLELVHREKRGLMRKAMDWVLREASKAKPQAADRLRRRFLGG